MSTEIAFDAPPAHNHRGLQPGIGIVMFGLILAFANTLLAYMVAESKLPDGPYFDLYATAYVLRSIVLWQGIAFALFAIDRRFRNPRSAAKIYCWTSLAVLLGTMAQIGAMLSG